MLCLVFTQNLSKNKGAFSCQDVFSTIYCQKVKEKREVQLLQHGEHGVQILQVNPFAIKFKVFNSDSWVQLITFNLDNSTTPKQQQQSSTPLGVYFCLSPMTGWEQPEDLPWAKPEKLQRQDFCLRTLLLPPPNKLGSSGYWTTWSCSPVLPDQSSPLLLLVGSPQRTGLDPPLALCPLSSAQFLPVQHLNGMAEGNLHCYQPGARHVLHS